MIKATAQIRFEEMASPKSRAPNAKASKLSNPRTEIYATDMSSRRIANACRPAPVKNKTDMKIEGHRRVSPAELFMKKPPEVNASAANISNSTVNKFCTVNCLWLCRR